MQSKMIRCSSSPGDDGTREAESEKATSEPVGAARNFGHGAPLRLSPPPSFLTLDVHSPLFAASEPSYPEST